MKAGINLLYENESWLQYIEELKKIVLKKAGIKYLNPRDCRILSDLIFESIGKRISITTLKRVYGFAISSIKPSLHTISILEEFSQMEERDTGFLKMKTSFHD